MEVVEADASRRADEFAKGSAVFLKADLIWVGKDLLFDAKLGGGGEVHFADLGG